MGANTFADVVEGETAAAAFKAATEEARHQYGHGGYSGTIAEKTEFVMIRVPANFDGSPIAYADQLIEDCDERIDDKWGPAGCIELGGGRFLFFGWASS